MHSSYFRPRITTLAACALLLTACETYKAEGSQGAAERTETAVKTPAAAEPAEPPAATPVPAAAAEPTAGAGPTCDDVVAHLVALTQKEIAGLGEAEREQAAAVLPAVKAQVTQACATSNWSSEFKKCILAATTEANLRDCEKFAPTPDSTVTIPPKPPGTPATPAAKAPADGPECNKVVDHVIKVALAAPDIPDAQREQMKTALPQQRPLMVQACDSTPWPGALRTCLLEAKTAADIQGCRVHAGP